MQYLQLSASRPPSSTQTTDTDTFIFFVYILNLSSTAFILSMHKPSQMGNNTAFEESLIWKLKTQLKTENRVHMFFRTKFLPFVLIIISESFFLPYIKLLPDQHVTRPLTITMYCIGTSNPIYLSVRSFLYCTSYIEQNKY